MACKSLHRLAILLPCAWAAACTSPPTDPRQAWLVEQLGRDNSIWLGRDPHLLAWKYERMAADPYDWVRGSLGLWLADMGRPGTDRVPTAFGLDPDSAQVLLVGDPHPENFGTMLPGAGPGPDLGDPAGDSAGLRLELNDLDAAAWGPWILDLRRAALGVATLANGLDACDPTCVDAAVEALVVGYTETALGRRAFEPDGGEDRGALLDGLLDEAEGEGRERARLYDRTEEDGDGHRRLRTDAALSEEGEGILALSDEEAQQVARLTAALEAEGPEGFRLLDAARRYGAGVSSLPAVRYVLLWDRGAPESVDDDLMNIREVVDPPVFSGLQGTVPGLFDDQADRVGRAPALLWSTADADAVMAGLPDGVQTFKATTWSSWFQGFEREEARQAWDEGAARSEDLQGLATVLGAALAASHGRAPLASGDDAGPVLARELEGREQELLDETLSAARSDLARTLADRLLLEDALVRYGPLLGIDELGEGVSP